jgi:hypothetical protein
VEPPTRRKICIHIKQIFMITDFISVVLLLSSCWKYLFFSMYSAFCLVLLNWHASRPLGSRFTLSNFQVFLPLFI